MTSEVLTMQIVTAALTLAVLLHLVWPRKRPELPKPPEPTAPTPHTYAGCEEALCQRCDDYQNGWADRKSTAYSEMHAPDCSCLMCVIESTDATEVLRRVGRGRGGRNRGRRR